MHRASLWVLALLVLALSAGGCGASIGGGYATASAPPASEADMAAPGDKAPEPGTWKRSQLQAHTSRIKVGDREELPVRSMQAKVAVQGHLARVLIDFTFRNPESRTYEGNFQLRLPDGASPYFFAFGENTLAIAGDAPPTLFTAAESAKMGLAPSEIMTDRQSLWRSPQEARMVPKEKAAFAYGSTVRRAVDPALVEWSGPSVFSARVFPITADRTHRIVFGYDVPLVRLGDTLEYTFDLPEKVPSVTVDVDVTEPAAAEVEVSPAAGAGSSKRYYRFDTPSEKSITVRVKKAGATVLTGSDPAIGSFFAAAVTPTLPAASAAKPSEAGLFLIDTSLSSNPDRFNIWLRLLETLLEKNRDTMKRFGAIFFDVSRRPFRAELLDNTKENADALLAFARTQSLEGATDLHAALADAARMKWPSAPAKMDVFLLSDGASTWGEPDLHAMAKLLEGGPLGPLYAYQTGLAGTDNEALSVLTRESGGAVFSVTGDSEVLAAATAHRARPFGLAGVSLAGTSDVLIAGRPRFVYPGQTLTLAGRGAPEKGASLELALETDAGKKIVKVPLGDSVSSSVAARAYGQVAVSQIEELSPSTDTAGKAYATHFRVTGKTCSLLMLESEADYQRFGIRPEQDAAFVKQSEASKLVADALAQVAATLGNSKAAFLRWLQGLESAPGMTFKTPPALRAALDRMPESSFQVTGAPLAIKDATWQSVPAPIAAALKTHQLEYDAVSAEAERRKAQLGPGDALRALSSLVEENPGDGVLARDVGFSAMTWGQPSQAYHLFRRVAASRPFEPQTYRAMASVLTAMGQIDLAIAYFEIGLAGQWDGRFGEFRRILGVEYQHLLRRVSSGEAKTTVADFAKERLSAVAREFPVGRADILVMITWNTDNTDVDLHVLEPNGEDCHYAHRDTSGGGHMTADVTRGYGPEMYTIESAPSGTYTIQAHYYASDRNRASTRTKVQATVYENWGAPNQRVTDQIVTLEYNKAQHPIGVVKRGASLQTAAP